MDSFDIDGLFSVPDSPLRDESHDEIVVRSVDRVLACRGIACVPSGYAEGEAGLMCSLLMFREANIVIGMENMSMKILLVSCLNVGVLVASVAASVSGVVSNRFGRNLGFAEITATRVGNPDNVVQLAAGRSGNYGLDLEVGEWLLELDAAQLAEWGYQMFAMSLSQKWREWILCG